MKDQDNSQPVDVEAGTQLGTRIVTALLDECAANGAQGAFALIGNLDANQAKWALLSATIGLDEIRNAKRTAGWN